MNNPLSQKRARNVATFLTAMFKGTPGVTFISFDGLGEEGSGPDAASWPHDRRVDVDVIFEAPWVIEARENPYTVYRSNIFKNYYPFFYLWRELHLEYLVDQYEERDTVTFRPADEGKLRDLIQALTVVDPATFGSVDIKAVDNALGPPVRHDALVTAYEVIHRRAWNYTAYPKYQKAFLKYFDENPTQSHEEKVRTVSSTDGGA